MTGVFIPPLPVPESDRVCECCASRGLHVYRADCLRCYARDMARGIPRLERARRAELAKSCDPEWVSTLKRLVVEERNADAAAGYGRAGHAEGRA